jgi:hypothetical protein
MGPVSAGQRRKAPDTRTPPTRAGSATARRAGRNITAFLGHRGAAVYGCPRRIPRPPGAPVTTVPPGLAFCRLPATGLRCGLARSCRCDPPYAALEPLNELQRLIAFRHARAMGLEGILSKRRYRPYRSGHRTGPRW